MSDDNTGVRPSTPISGTAVALAIRGDTGLVEVSPATSKIESNAHTQLVPASIGAAGDQRRVVHPTYVWPFVQWESCLPTNQRVARTHSASFLRIAETTGRLVQ